MERKIIIKPKKSILDIKPYIPGKSGSKNNKKIIKLSSNETPLGTSAKALKILKESFSASRYPDGSSNNLRKLLAHKFKININNIICGNGSDEVLSLFAHCFSGPGDEVIYSKHGFLVYPIAIRAAGSKPISVPEKNYKADVNAILKKVTKKTKICFIANPNNPTGTYLTKKELIKLRKNLPNKCLLVIDSAYAEYVDEDDYTDGFDLVKKYSNVACTRTFSKIYGLAALRIGWAYSSKEIIELMNRVRLPFNLNTLGQKAAIEAIKDQAFVNKAKNHNKKWKPYIEKKLNQMGLETIPGVANFVLVKFKNEKQANSCYTFLEKNNIYVRKISEYGLPNFLRITVGLKNENIILCKLILKFINK